MILLIDNYDSFTYNVYQDVARFSDVTVVRNDELSVEAIRDLNPSGIIISPGPGGPQDAGVSLDVVRELSGVIPILGVCLGHQVIAEAFGGTVGRANQVMHGKTSRILTTSS
ncbi:MAG: gamma-glutamyl-gamma-aminobutyrate hydrolase family protein, partial [Exiguobacterium sp.]|nr:gamma-glutamyl-gamma-aminobutyrate hydrolase family protein [Exiguobacterium sp.]MDX5425678.1 gamma-glutamyl-gamma-aminobutyrate hydrolase family protein [Exiguobacterium sp.]MDX6773078.1 gamma-glutamyl-gamma-aminobutyrate hydrolase family protein [Exiguobacterium sp.]